MTQEEQDLILGRLLREKREAKRELGACQAKAERLLRDIETARTALLKEVGWIKNDQQPPAPFVPFEDGRYPSPDEVLSLLKEMRELSATVRARVECIEAIEPGTSGNI